MADSPQKTKTTPKKPPTPRKVKRSPTSLLDSGSVKISTLLSYKTTTTENRTLMAVVTAMSPGLKDHEIIFKKRKRVCLVDTTGAMLAYVMTKGFMAEIGDVLAIKDFSVTLNRLTLHINTIIGRGQKIKVSQDDMDVGSQMLQEPVRTYTSIPDILRTKYEQHSNVSMKGEVSRVSAMTVVKCSASVPTPSGKLIKRDIDVEDTVNEKKITVSLFDETAMYEIFVGFKVLIHDSPIYHNTMLNTKVVSVYYADNIILIPCNTVVETVYITSVEASTSPGYMTLIIRDKTNSTRRDIHQQRLLRGLGEGYEQYTADEIRKICPLEGKASILGGEITKLVVHTITEHDMDVSVNFSQLYSCSEDDPLDPSAIASLFDEEIQEGDDFSA